MDEKQLFDNPDYPVSVNFVELNPNSSAIGEEVEARNVVEVLIVNNGTLRILMNDSMYTATAGQGVLINANVAHRRVPVGNEVCGAYSVRFSTTIICGGSEYFCNKYVLPFLNSTRTSVIVLSEDNIRDEGVLDGFNKVIATNLIRRNGYEILTKGYLCTLWMTLLEYTEGGRIVVTGKNAPSQDEVRTSAILEYIAENYSDQIKLEDISRHISMSEGECSRLFSRVLGRPLFDYIVEYRIYQVLRVLYKDPLSVESIFDLASSAGFNNISYFNKVFKKFTQTTPNGFRKMIKSEPEQADKIYMRVQESVRELM